MKKGRIKKRKKGKRNEDRFFAMRFETIGDKKRRVGPMYDTQTIEKLKSQDPQVPYCQRLRKIFEHKSREELGLCKTVLHYNELDLHSVQDLSKSELIECMIRDDLEMYKSRGFDEKRYMQKLYTTSQKGRALPSYREH
jgi:hypothetical protein